MHSRMSMSSNLHAMAREVKRLNLSQSNRIASLFVGVPISILKSHGIRFRSQTNGTENKNGKGEAVKK